MHQEICHYCGCPAEFPYERTAYSRDEQGMEIGTIVYLCVGCKETIVPPPAAQTMLVKPGPEPKCKPKKQTKLDQQTKVASSDVVFVLLCVAGALILIALYLITILVLSIFLEHLL